MFKRTFSYLIFGLFLFALMSCTQEKSKQETAEQTAAKKQWRTAVATMAPTTGNTAHGTVTFTEVDGGIKVNVHLEGVPEGKHGFHIHENGDCGNDGKAAGGHWNPEGKPHGSPDSTQHHIGDLGNVTANADGVVDSEVVYSFLTFDGENSILGKGVILHAKADDLTSQPTGAAGARIACGVITLQEK